MKSTIFKFKLMALLMACTSMTLFSCNVTNADNGIRTNVVKDISHNEPEVIIEEEPQASVEGSSLIQLALLLDTSNSMDGLINQAKSQLWKIVNELSKAKHNGDPVKLNIALYEYGNDNLNGKEGYIRQVTPLIDDLDKISEELFALTTLGGNEFCGQVIQSSLDQLDWSNDEILKLIYIAGNEPFTQGSVDYKEVCKRAKNENVVVNTIFCGMHEEGIDTFWKDGALYGDGEYMSIQQDEETVYIKSPFDDRIMELNTQLNGTYLAYGSQGGYYLSNQAAQDANAGSIAKENAVERSISKSSRVYDNKRWDLVDKCEEEGFDIGEFEKEELPEVMQDMDEEEMTELIEEKKKERETINQEIKELSVKRAEFIAAEKEKLGEDSSLENAMIQSLKKKARELNYTFE